MNKSEKNMFSLPGVSIKIGKFENFIFPKSPKQSLKFFYNYFKREHLGNNTFCWGIQRKYFVI